MRISNLDVVRFIIEMNVVGKKAIGKQNERWIHGDRCEFIFRFSMRLIEGKENNM